MTMAGVSKGKVGCIAEDEPRGPRRNAHLPSFVTVPRQQALPGNASRLGSVSPTPGPDRLANQLRPLSREEAPMSVTLVLGGSRSGKSRYAESLLRGYRSVTYVAPGPRPDGSDPEWAERISLHQARRPPTWSTLETAELVDVIGTADHPVLIDCLSTWLTHLIDEVDAWQDRVSATSHVAKETALLLDALGAATVDVVLVTSEVGLAVVPSTSSGRMFRDELGKLNGEVSAVSDRVALVIAGRVLDLSGCPLVTD
jgi:adenosylcobinamide kinase/adenosylcobinamide-phosphate guanylyltransferase